jgi:hypothetical protein
MRPRRVRVEIGALVLRGFDPAQRDGIAAGLRAELERLLTERAAGDGFAEGRSTSVLRLGGLRVSTGGSPHVVGRLVAASVARSLGRSPGAGQP